MLAVALDLQPRSQRRLAEALRSCVAVMLAPPADDVVRPLTNFNLDRIFSLFRLLNPSCDQDDHLQISAVDSARGLRWS